MNANGDDGYNFPMSQAAWTIQDEPFSGLSPTNTRPQTRSHPVSPFTAQFSKAEVEGLTQGSDHFSEFQQSGDDSLVSFKRSSKERAHHSTFPRRRPHARNSSNLDTFDVGRASLEISSNDSERMVSGSDWSDAFSTADRKSGRESRCE